MTVPLPPHLPQPLLSVQNLTVEYPGEGGWTTAVKRISFDIVPGGALALVGESGSGKSSTAMAIGRLTDLSAARLSGKILFEGQDVTTMDPKNLMTIRRTGLAYVFQEPMVTLNPVLRVRAQMEEVLSSADRAGGGASVRMVISKFLEEARIPATDSARVADAFPHELSGGLQQRVMIAMALAKNAKLLVADEPTTALDATVQKEILLTLKELRKTRGLAILFITHDLQAARAIADKIEVMQNGQIVDSLTRESKFEPKHPYSKRLMAASLLNQAPKTRIEVA